MFFKLEESKVEEEEEEEEEFPPRRPPRFDHDPLLHYPGYLLILSRGAGKNWILLGKYRSLCRDYGKSKRHKLGETKCVRVLDPPVFSLS